MKAAGFDRFVVFGCTLLVFAAVLCMTATSYLNDDAVISYRYAWNLARGYGLATWPGGPVEEGFSNPLLVLLSAAGGGLIADAERMAAPSGLDAVIRSGMLLNYLGAIGIIVIAVIWPGTRIGRWLAAMVTVLAYPLAWYLHTGLETPLYTFFITAFAWSAVHRRWSGAALTALCAAMTRTDGVLLVGLAWLVMVASLWHSDADDRGRTFKSSVKWGGIFIAGYALFTVWRVVYFGDWLPTPLLVKGQLAERGVFDGRGLAYILANARAYPLFVFAFVLGMGAFLKGERRWRYLPVTALVIGQLGLTVAVGGDEIHLGACRFLLPVFPMLVIGSVFWFESIRSRWVTALLAVALIAGCFPYFNAMDNEWHLRYGRFAANYMNNPYETVAKQWMRWRDPEPWIDAEAGRAMAKLVRDDGRGLSMASVQAGSLPVHWRGEFIDLLGLTSRAYAGKTPAEKDMAFRRNPPDLFMAFRWEGGWFPIPSVKVLKDLGYQPVILIQLQEIIEERWGPAAFTINFLVFVRDANIFAGVAEDHWDGMVGISYSDGRDSIDRDVLLKQIPIYRGIVNN